MHKTNTESLAKRLRVTTYAITKIRRAKTIMGSNRENSNIAIKH